MFAILGFSLCLLLVMLVIPDSALGRVLHRQLVERPLERLAQLERHHLIYAVIIGSMMIAGGEAVAIAGPELVAMWALDVSIYLDAVLVTYALSALATMRGIRARAGQIVIRLFRTRPRTSRRRIRVRPRPQPSNDDEDHAPLKAAA